MLQIPLQIATSTMAVLAVGIGADYANLTWRLRAELKDGAEAVAIAATSTTGDTSSSPTSPHGISAAERRRADGAGMKAMSA